MTQFIHVVTLLGITLLPANGAQRAGADEEFVGSTPCDAAPRRFLGIPKGAACERITWHLAFSPDPESRTFSLRVVYGIQARNDPGFEGGGMARTLNGGWAADPGRVVYRLTANHLRQPLGFRKVGDDLLHLLDDRGALMVGNGGWSYTLSRKDGAPRRKPPVSFEPVSGVVPGTVGLFEGRTPCQELSGRLPAIASRSDCTKLKWALTLHQDPVTRAPTTYVLEGTAYRTAPRKGTWTVLRSRQDPRIIVYRLDADQPGRSLSFFRADDNILLFMNEEGALLVGDSHFSYTLNRAAGKARPRAADRRPGTSIMAS